MYHHMNVEYRDGISYLVSELTTPHKETPSSAQQGVGVEAFEGCKVTEEQSLLLWVHRHNEKEFVRYMLMRNIPCKSVMVVSGLLLFISTIVSLGSDVS